MVKTEKSKTISYNTTFDIIFVLFDDDDCV